MFLLSRSAFRLVLKPSLRPCLLNTRHTVVFPVRAMASSSRVDPAEEAIREFSKITGVDEGLAHFFLQDFEFDLKRGLERYYTQLEGESKKPADKKTAENSDSDIEFMDTSELPIVSPEAMKQYEDQFPPDITVMSWNVDGIDEGNLHTRFKAVIYVVAKANPEILLLQEVVAAHLPEINRVFGDMYYVITPFDKEMPYFTVTLIAKNIQIRSQIIRPFSNTAMGRTMTVVEGYWQKLRIVVINTHLESMREYANQRKTQFRECMREVEKNIDADTLVVFGGDLNIRDAEIPPLLPGVKDAWVAAGSKANTKYTWDCKLNTNKGLPPNVRCRFDRLYYCGPYTKVDFTLHGTQQIRRVFCYPSDHFAICARFSTLPKK